MAPRSPLSPPPDTGETAPGTPLWQSLATAKQDQVFHAAVEEFAERGYDAASMNTLVRRAGISKGSLFTYFRSKAGLFDAVVERAAGRIREDLRRLRDESRDEPFARRLEALVRTGFAFIDQHPHLARIYFSLLQRGSAPGGESRAESLRRRSRDFLEELILQGQTTGELRVDLPAPRMAFLLNLQLESLLACRQEEGPAPGRGARSKAALAQQARREEWIHDFLCLALDGMQVRVAPTRKGARA